MELRHLEGIGAIAAADWDRLVLAGNPFVGHAYLAALETSGSATKATGWQPLHLTVQEAGRVIAAAPLYAKGHSYGEYVFDHGWAEAYDRAGGRYYPKLLVAVPFTPVPGPRLLGEGLARETLAAALVATTDRLGLSSLHVNFCREDEATLLAEAGCLLRRGIQYHWSNPGYRDFDDFLDSLKSARRKVIRRERREVRNAGIEIETLQGGARAAAALAAFHPLYLETVDRRWGNAYLTPELFQLLAERLGRRIVLVTARRAGRLIAAALNIEGGDTLYGRLWGAVEDHPFLHFELCYYQAIEHAIRHRLARIEAGAQGPHKLQRGYAPVWTWSAHWIRDPGFRAAVRRFLAAETMELEERIMELKSLLPYREA